MFTVGGEEMPTRSWTSRGSNSTRYHRWTVRVLALVLLVLLQLESQVHFQTLAATPDDTASSGAATTSHSSGPQSSGASPSAPAASSSLIDGIILDEDGGLLGPAGQQTFSEEAATNLHFVPAQLNFAHRSIGDPHNQLIVLFNRHKNRSVYLGSISGSTAEFSSSYFKEKVIPPGGNTSFNVVFLPRKLGAADGSLLVHTSFGMLRYPVQGEGIECPYRLRPLVGLQAPLNATLAPEITLYNPHDTPLQIVEVYSSGGNFQLELPSGAQEGPQTLWEIPPHSTRTVIRVRFHARTPGNHLAYVRIKISGGPANPSLVDKMLVVPIEVEILKETGLYSRIPFLELGVTSSLSEVVSTAARHTTAAPALAAPVDDSEFGLSVRSGRNVTRLSLDLYNSGSQLVRVKSWLVQADDMESIHCMQVLVGEGPTLHVEFDWSKLTSERRHISGRILLKLERILSSPDGGEHALGDEEDAEEDGEQQEEAQSQDESAGTESRIVDEYERVVVRMNEYDGTTATTEDAVEGGGGGAGSERSKVVPSVYYIPFAGEVLKGSIQYNEEVLRFLLPAHDQPSSAAREEEEAAAGRGRELVVRNHFNVPLSITNISVPENCSRYFAIENFRPIVLQPNDERTLLRIHRKVADTVWADTAQPFTIVTSFRLATNITDYELPVQGYSGRLERLLSPTVRDASLLTPTGLAVQPAGRGGLDGGAGAQELDFGVLPIATIGEALVAFRNPNPIPIPIIHWKGAITSDGAVGAPTITVILRGCGPLRLDGLVFCHTVQPGEWIVYQISVQSGTIDSYQGRFTVKTDYEEIVTPLRFTTAVGELHLMRERLRFDDCFPGKLCSLSLLAASSFPTKIQIESIRTDVPGLSYEFLSADKQRPLAPNQPVALHPDTVTSIGRMTLDPKAHCGPVADCYSSFDLLSKPFGVKWMATLDCYEQYRRLDSDKLLQQLQRYAEMRQRLTSVHFQVLAESSRRFDFNASVDLVWPKLLDENVFFPTLQVEQEAVRLITINNPSDQILFVHLVLHDVAIHGRQPIVDGGGGVGSGINLPPEVLTACDNCTLSEESVFSFFLFDSDDIYVNYVKPQSFLRIAIKFSAQVPGTYSTVLYMRNNLTLIDAAWIQARAVVPLFKFGNRRPGSPTALQFEITEKHAQPCYDRFYRKLRSEGRFKKYYIDAQGQKHDVTQDEPVAGGDGEEKMEFVVETRRTFTARNYGEVPILISGIRIEETPCEGFGFKVLDCTPFELAPNASRKIEIAFAPDFTLSRVMRVLHFDTNINHFSVNFTLLGTVPMHRLDVCNRVLPRPWFEYWFRAVLFVVLPTVLFGTLAAAVLDSNRVLRVHFLSLVREKGPLQPPLDLRQIALQHSNAAGDGAGGSASGGKELGANGSKEGRAGGGSTNHQNGSLLSSSSTVVVSRSHRKPDRKNGTHSKGGTATATTGLLNGSANSSSVASSGESTASRFNRSWTDFTTKLGATTKPILTASPTSLTSSLLDAGGRALQASLTKSRRSITPSKEQPQSSISTEELISNSPSSSSSSSSSSSTSGNSGATKDRTKSPSSTSETENKCTKNGPFGGKTAPSNSSTSDLTGVLESNSAASKQHHHTTCSSSSLTSSSSSMSSASSVAATEEPAAEERPISLAASLSLSSPSSCSSSSSSSSASTTSSSSSSPSPTSKQQHHHHHHQHNHQSKQQSATTATTKTNVKKTKSLPVSYESVVVSLASVFAATSTLARMGTTTTTYTSQKPTAEVTSSTVVTLATVASPTTKDTVPSVQTSTKEIPSKLRTGPSNGATGKQLVSASNGNGSTKATVASNNKQQDSSVSCVKPGGDKANPFSGTAGGADSGGKENSSSGNIISQEKLSIGNGNAQVESSLQHLQQTKKFSKTPGRERKPNQSKKGTNGKGTSTGGGVQHYKGTALQFNTPAQQQHKSTTLGTILQNASVPVPSSAAAATVWGENCARFSDVVAQTPATKHGGKQSTVSSMLLGMEALPWLSGASSSSSSSSSSSNQNADKSSNHVRSHGTNAYGTMAGSTAGSTPNYRKPLHSLQELPSNGSGPTSSSTIASNRTEQKSKDDSYIGGSLEKECSAPFVATSASPDLGPIGTSKKSPTGGHNADGEEEESDLMMGHMAGGRGGSNMAKCWEPFGGHVIHNPTQLAGGSSSESAATLSKTMNGGQQSDSFFSQSFADFPHRQNDQYRGIASMAGGSNGNMNGITTSSLLSIAGHGFTDHSAGLSNGGNNQQTDIGGPGSVENGFMDAHRASFHSSGQQQHQHQQNNHHDWNNTMEAHMQWPMSTHKPLASQSGGLNQNWRSADLWNSLNAQHQYQQQQHHQQQQQQQMAYESVLHFHSQLAMAAAGANQLPGNHPLQHQQQTVPDVRLGHRATNLNDAWLGTAMPSGQTTVAPPPGFSNHLPSVGSHTNMSGLPSNRIVYQDPQQAYNMLLQHRLQQQQQQQQQQSQQQLIRQLSSEEPNIIDAGNGTSRGSAAVSTTDPASGQTAVTAASTASTSGSSTGTSGSSSSSSSYSPFQFPSIWSPANNIDVWAASTGSSEET